MRSKVIGFYGTRELQINISVLYFSSPVDALMKTTVEMLRVYEKECAALYVNDKKNNAYSSVEERVRRVQEKCVVLLL